MCVLLHTKHARHTLQMKHIVAIAQLTQVGHKSPPSALSTSWNVLTQAYGVRSCGPTWSLSWLCTELVQF